MPRALAILYLVLVVGCSAVHREPPASDVGDGSAGSSGAGQESAGRGGAGGAHVERDAMVDPQAGAGGQDAGALSVECAAEARECSAYGSRPCDTVACPTLDECPPGTAPCRGLCAADCYPLPECLPACLEQGSYEELSALCSARSAESCATSDEDGGPALCQWAMRGWASSGCQ